MKTRTIHWVLVGMASCAAIDARALGNGSGTEGTAPAANAATAPADLAFVRKAAIGGMAEVELGKLAQRKGSSEPVRQFGAQMVQDHTKTNDELKQIASMKQIDIPQSLDPKHQNDVAHFSTLSGAAFDRAYMKDMVADHRKDIADFKRAAASAKDTDLRTFASRTLPTLESHLQMAQAGSSGAKGVK